MIDWLKDQHKDQNLLKDIERVLAIAIAGEQMVSATHMNAVVAGMMAQNEIWASQGDETRYDEGDFRDLLDRYAKHLSLIRDNVMVAIQ